MQKISAKQAKISIGVLSALIQAGALESLNTKTRSRLVLEAQTWNILKDKEKILVKQLIEQKRFEDVLTAVKALNTEIKDDKGKFIIKDSRFSTIKRDYERFKTIYLLNSRNEKLANFFYEKELLGMPYSESLSCIFKQKNDNIQSIEECNQTKEKSSIFDWINICDYDKLNSLLDTNILDTNILDTENLFLVSNVHTGNVIFN